ncbi:MAG TPA: hypothetical protein VK116_11070, partial [Planctomycetota bacterium]|nr:hypothetical protein [Planctomycetota bacterium]
LMNAQGRAYLLKDTSNLKAIHQAAFLYSNKKGNRYPFSTDRDARAHDHLNRLVQSSSGSDLEPKVFTSEVQNEDPATPDEDGKYLLAEENLSYTWTMEQKRNTDQGPLSCNKWYKGLEIDGEKKTIGHNSVVMMLDTKGSVIELDMIDIDTIEKYEIEDGLPKGLTR